MEGLAGIVVHVTEVGGRADDAASTDGEIVRALSGHASAGNEDVVLDYIGFQGDAAHVAGDLFLADDGGIQIEPGAKTRLFF